MAYVVIVKHVTEVKGFERKDWRSDLKTEYLTLEEYEALSFTTRRDWRLDDNPNNGATRKVSGYARVEEVTNRVEEEVYTQTVKDIDLKAVINAVNKIISVEI